MEKDHNLDDPKEIVPVILRFFDPRTVCDVGCGIGTFLHVFRNSGRRVMGFDGAWVNKELLSRHLSHDEFREVDFEREFPLIDEKFDLALCLEVAEHLQEENAARLVKFLTSLSDTIIFSAAIPFQGGDNHYNERWEEYWEERFNDLGYRKYDIIRHQIWNNKGIRWWYRQNIVVYSRNDLSRFPSVSYEGAVTRECYENKTAMLINFSGLVVPNLWVGLKLYVVTGIRRLFGEQFYHRIKRN